MNHKKGERTAIKPVKFKPVKHAPGIDFKQLQPDSRICLVVILCLLGIFGWGLFTVRAIDISSVPEQAEIDIDTLFKLKLARRYLVFPGDYAIHLSAEGYHPLRDTLSVDKKIRGQKVAYRLEKLPGHLQLVLDRGIEAEISVDGVSKGKISSIVTNIMPGKRRIQITADGYLPWRREIDIQGMGRIQILEPEMKPAWANVSITSSPVAMVYIDGKKRGKTPLKTEIMQGRRMIMINLDDYKPWERELDIVAGEDVQLHGIELEKADVVINIKSRPGKASVTINGEYRGQTPLQVAVDADKKNNIRLFKQGYQRYSRDLVLQAGNKRTLDIILLEERVEVQFKVSPADAELFIDGESRGAATQTLSLVTRPHKIEIKKPGYINYASVITPGAGIRQIVNAVLKSEQEAKQESVKSLIQTAAGQQLKLFRPNVGFLMGASRREPGRRANETLRKVKLTRPFYLALKEISNAQYRMYHKEHTSKNTGGMSLDGDDQPVVNISWEQAAMYCNWLSTGEGLVPVYRLEGGKITGFDSRANGYRLPTEAEWAWAARYQGPNNMLKFPWGEKFPPTGVIGNFADQSAANIVATVIPGYRDGYIVTAPTGSFAPNFRGIWDISGNAAEWIHDYYAAPVEKAVLVVDPMGPKKGRHHVIRGAGWAQGNISVLRLSYRDYGEGGRDDTGFRIARYLE